MPPFKILDTNPFLFFRLQQQRLIELIRAGKVTEALTFAAEELAPRGEEHPTLLPELERTMALLLFYVPSSLSGPKSGALTSSAAGSIEPPSYVSELLTPAQRLKTAGEVNAAILASQNQDKDPKLPQLLKILSFGERLLGAEGPGKTEFPHIDFEAALRAQQHHGRDAVEGGDAMAL